MENEIDPVHSRVNGALIPDIAQVELHVPVLPVPLGHVVLFLLIPAEDANLPGPGVEALIKEGATECSGSTGNQDGRAAESCVSHATDTAFPIWSTMNSCSSSVSSVWYGIVNRCLNIS